MRVGIIGVGQVRSQAAKKDVFSDQTTRIYPLTDFSPRKREAWERGYLTGRYGAVPFFSELPDILKHTLARRGKPDAKQADPATA